MTDLLSSLRGVAVALYLFVSAGNVSAAAVPVESFAAQQTLKDPRISSNGSYLAVSADLGDDDHGWCRGTHRLEDKDSGHPGK